MLVRGEERNRDVPFSTLRAYHSRKPTDRHFRSKEVTRISSCHLNADVRESSLLSTQGGRIKQNSTVFSCFCQGLAVVLLHFVHSFPDGAENPAESIRDNK